MSRWTLQDTRARLDALAQAEALACVHEFPLRMPPVAGAKRRCLKIDSVWVDAQGMPRRAFEIEGGNATPDSLRCDLEKFAQLRREFPEVDVEIVFYRDRFVYRRGVDRRGWTSLTTNLETVARMLDACTEADAGLLEARKATTVRLASAL